eukprot:8603749-Heterocapsa_arctica.AAC.1
MGQQNRQVHQAGVQGQQDELSSGHENIMRKFISDDRSSFSRTMRNPTTIWRSRNFQANVEYKAAQHQQQLEHFSSLEHPQ